MGDVIYASFGRRVQIGRSEWERGAERCEAAATSQDEITARTLRRLAWQYRNRAAEEGGE